MDRNVPGRVLPLTDAETLLMAAAVHWDGRPMSLSELGRHAGISKFAASRAGQHLRQTELLVESETDLGRWVFHRQHSLAGLVSDLMWTLMGAIAPANESGVLPGGVLLEQEVRRRRLKAGEIDAHLGGVEGPPVARVRSVVAQLRHLTHRLYEFDAVCRQLHSRSGNERHRDLAHQFMHLGARAFDATTGLLDAVTAPRNPMSVTWVRPEDRVPAGHWVAATYAVGEEVQLVHRLLQLLGRGSAVTSELGRVAHGLFAGLGRTAQQEPGEVLEAAKARAHRFDEVWSAAVEENVAWIGGTPSAWDQLSAGDEVFRVELREVGEALLAVLRQMAVEECVVQYQAVPGVEGLWDRDLPDA